jgi:hypothetical protein
MTALCADELRRVEPARPEPQHDDPEIIAASRSRLTVRAALIAVALNLDTFDHPEHEADEC